MTDVRLYLDRFLLSVQEKRERSAKGESHKRTLAPLDWRSVIPHVGAMAGKHVKITEHRYFAIVDSIYDEKAKIPHHIVECGVFDPRKSPKAWKDGERAVKDVKLPSGYQWFHPTTFILPDHGQQIILMHSRSGPHVEDICAWLKGMLKVNFVDANWDPPLKFKKALDKAKKFKVCTLKLARTDRTVATQELPEAEIGRATDAESITVILRPGDSGFVAKSPVMELLKKVIPGWGAPAAGRQGRPYDYQLDDATLVPLEDGATVMDIVRFKDDCRRQVVVSAAPSGEPQKLEVYKALAEDLTEWLA